MAKIGSDGLMVERKLCCLQCKKWTDHKLNAAGNAYVCQTCGDHITYSRADNETCVPFGVQKGACGTAEALDE